MVPEGETLPPAPAVAVMLYAAVPVCVIVKAAPAIVRVATLDPALVLGATEYPTIPFPVPEAPDVMVTHDAVLVVVQLQVPDVVRLTLPVPPPES